MAIAMVAMLAFGGTYAFFTAEANSTAQTFHTGLISIKDAEAVNLVTTGKVLDGEDVADGIQFTNESNRGAWLFVKVTATYTKGETTAALPAGVLNLTPTGTWQPLADNDGVYYMSTSDEAPQTGAITVCSALKLNADVHYDDGVYNEALSVTKADLMDADITITINAYAIQLEGNADQATAWGNVIGK